VLGHNLPQDHPPIRLIFDDHEDVGRAIELFEGLPLTDPVGRARHLIAVTYRWSEQSRRTCGSAHTPNDFAGVRKKRCFLQPFSSRGPPPPLHEHAQRYSYNHADDPPDTLQQVTSCEQREEEDESSQRQSRLRDGDPMAEQRPQAHVASVPASLLPVSTCRTSKEEPTPAARVVRGDRVSGRRMTFESEIFLVEGRLNPITVR
jgi:hypothetical protein